MATDPKKDQKDQSEQMKRDATAGKPAELTEKQLKDIAAGDPGRITPGGNQTEVKRYD